MKRIIALVLALVASTAVGASVQIPQRNASGGGYDIKGSDGTKTPCAGCIGEVKATTTSGTLTSGGATDLSGTTTVTAGTWLVTWNGGFFLSGAVTAAPNYMGVTVGGALLTVQNGKDMMYCQNTFQSNNNYPCGGGSFVYVATGNTVLQMRAALVSYTSGTLSASGYINAVRIY